MSNANRDYAIVYDVKNSLLVLNRPLNFYLTDKNTSNIFVKLVTRVIVGDGIDQYTDIENASSYVLTMRVIKPDDEVKSIIATQHESESIFQFDLTEDFKDVPGKYICELTISNIVNGRQEFTTSDPFNYEVKRSILSNVKNIIEGKDTTVEKLLNDLDATKAELSSQIKDKANENEVRKKSTNITLNDCDSDMLNAIKGGENTNFEILSIPRDESITLEKFNSSDLIPVTTSKRNRNMFNKNTAIQGKYIGAGNGLLMDDSSYYASDFIKVDGNTQYTISHLEQSAFYDGDKNYISGINTSSGANVPYTFASPSNAKYIRVSVRKDFINKYQLELGSVSNPYEKYGCYLRQEDIEPELFNSIYYLTKERIVGGIYQPTKLPNMFDKNTAIQDKYIGAGNGVLSDGVGYYASDFIKVDGNTQYTISHLEQSAFYDSDKKYISGINTSSGANVPYTFASPSNAKYIRVSIRKDFIDVYVLSEGDSVPTKTKYGYEIPIIDVENGTKLILSENTQMFDKNTAIQDKYIGAGNGVLSDGVGYYASDFIKVDGNTQYTISHLEQSAFYDSDKKYISGQSTSGLVANTCYTLTTPSNARYMRVSVLKDYIDIYKLEKGKFSTVYEDHNNLLSNYMYTPIQKITSTIINAPSKINIKLIGDSITHGLGGTGFSQDGETISDNWKINTSGHCWANSLKAYFEEKFNCSVTNFGMSGINSEGVHARIENLVTAEDDIIILMIGTNDRVKEGYRLERFLNLIISYIKRLGKQLILMSSIPAGLSNEQTSNYVIHMEDVDNIIMKVANNWKMEYISVYKLFIDYCDSRNIEIESLLCDDALHPNDDGYDVMFYLITKALGIATKRPGATW